MERLNIWLVTGLYVLVFAVSVIAYGIVEKAACRVASPAQTQAAGDAMLKPHAAAGVKLEDERVKVLVNQLKAKQAAFSNNIWQTMAALLTAIGMLFAVDKVREQLSAYQQNIPWFHIGLLGLYLVHAYAYGKYLQGSHQLYSLLNNVVGSQIIYFQGFRITFEQIALNLIFDTMLFVLLALVLDGLRVRPS